MMMMSLLFTYLNLQIYICFFFFFFSWDLLEGKTVNVYDMQYIRSIKIKNSQDSLLLEWRVKNMLRYSLLEGLYLDRFWIPVWHTVCILRAVIKTECYLSPISIRCSIRAPNRNWSALGRINSVIKTECWCAVNNLHG